MGIMGTTLTALTCMYEKPIPVMQAVLEGIGEADERIVVLDRPSVEVAMLQTATINGHNLHMPMLTGPPGWRSPCISWNAGLKHVTGDHLLILQGDVVLQPGSVAHIRQLLEERPAAYFGKVLESDPDSCKGPGHAGPVLCSSVNPRPLTYLMAVPTAAVHAINGWDEAFQAGVWYEDNDFTTRLWQHGLDFIFDDRIHGIHQSHQRAYSKPLAIATNQAIYLRKHGTSRFHDRERALGRLIVHTTDGRTEWRHPSVA